MENLTKALQQYLSSTDAKGLQIALDAMTPAIKADIIATIEETIQSAVETAVPGTVPPAQNFSNLAAQLHAKNSIEHNFCS